LEPDVVVELVPEVVVAVVPDVDVAVVIVVAVPEVSLIVPAGIADVDVEPVVPVESVAIVPVAIVPLVDEVSVVDIVVDVSVTAAPVSVLLLFVSLLQAKPKTLRAMTVRRTRSFLLMLFFLSLLLLVGRLNGVLDQIKKCLLTPLGNRLKVWRSCRLRNRIYKWALGNSQ
jgi:hypothetical protein